MAIRLMLREKRIFPCKNNDLKGISALFYRAVPPLAAAPISVGNQGAASNATGYPVAKVLRIFLAENPQNFTCWGVSPNPFFQKKLRQK